MHTDVGKLTPGRTTCSLPDWAKSSFSRSSDGRAAHSRSAEIAHISLRRFASATCARCEVLADGVWSHPMGSIKLGPASHTGSESKSPPSGRGDFMSKLYGVPFSMELLKDKGGRSFLIDAPVLQPAQDRAPQLHLPACTPHAVPAPWRPAQHCHAIRRTYLCSAPPAWSSAA